MIPTPTQSKGTSTREATGSTSTPKSGKRSHKSSKNSSSNGTPSKTRRAAATSSTSVTGHLLVDPMTEVVTKSRANRAAAAAAPTLNPPPPAADVNNDESGESEDMDMDSVENLGGNERELTTQPAVGTGNIPAGENVVANNAPAENVPAPEKVVQGNHPGYLPSFSQMKNVFNLNKYKRFIAPESLLPTEILLSKIKSDVSSEICRTLGEVRAKRSYTGVLFSDSSSTGADFLSKQIIPDCLKNVFKESSGIHYINFSEDLYHNQVIKIVEAIGKAISDMDRQSSIGGQTVVFLERIDKLWESISWEPTGRMKVAEALKNLLFHPILVLATSCKALDQINESDGLKLLFLNSSRIVQVEQPSDLVKIRVFMQIFIKHAAFKKALESYRDDEYNPITEYKLETLGKCLKAPFKEFMEKILKICHKKPLLYILTLYDYLYNIIVKNQQVDVEKAVKEISDAFDTGMAADHLIARLEHVNN